jgi:hypothetical protein
VSVSARVRMRLRLAVLGQVVIVIVFDREDDHAPVVAMGPQAIPYP